MKDIKIIETTAEILIFDWLLEKVGHTSEFLFDIDKLEKELFFKKTAKVDQ